MVLADGENRKRDRGIAQLVEQRSPKPRVESSNLSAPAIKDFTTSVVYVNIVKSELTNLAR
jgi:hypothetical protein